jgi:hypothetical protein
MDLTVEALHVEQAHTAVHRVLKTVTERLLGVPEVKPTVVG